MPPKQIQTKSSPPARSANSAYLLAYNFVSAILWLSVLGRVLAIGSSQGFASGKVYQGTERFSRLVQTGAVLEVLHSLFGVVRAPLFTTLMQVSSRILLTWGIAHPFPESTKYNAAYSSMLVAWSVTEVIRYGYFAFGLSGMGVPSWWTWLRYNTFLVLYPLGVSSEIYLIWSALPRATKIHAYYPHFLYAILFTYIPGFYTLFTYMLKQRRRVLG